VQASGKEQGLSLQRQPTSGSKQQQLKEGKYQNNHNGNGLGNVNGNKSSNNKDQMAYIKYKTTLCRHY